MHFFRVPKLGSFLAILFSYQSCQEEESLEGAYEDYVACQHKREEQEKEKAEWAEKVQEEREEKEKEGEAYEEPAKEWEEIKEATYKTHAVQYVVCLDTLGQDRAFTEE